jgi:membrane-associated HD superfamily phosphohydrolase
MVGQGVLIIENGTMVDDTKFRMLESLKNEYDRRLGVLGNKYLVVLGQTLLVTLFITLLMVFLSMFRKDIYADLRKMFLILSIVTGMLLVLSWALRLNLPTLYFIPYCIVPIIIRVIFDTRLALYIHLLVVVLAGFFVPNGYEFIFLQLTAGMVAINSIKNLLRRSQFLISAILIYATYVIGYIGISIIHEGSFIPINWDHLLWFLVSVILSLVAYPVIYAFEKLFGITTEVTLMEFTNINNKLLRELSYKAPGTFQHSLQVANLAEDIIGK